MYTIKRASEVTGVPAATLRAWERRYGLAAPQRTDTGYRLYDDRAIADIRAMQLLLDAGWAPRQAAAEVLRTAGHVGPTLGPDATGAAIELAADTQAFLAAAESMDEARMRDVLDEVFGRAAFEVVVDTWLRPALAEIGDRWSEGRLDIAAEHFASAAVMRRVGAAYEAAALVRGAPRVVVGLPPGGRHEIGSLAFATAVRRRGIAATYLGADLPAGSWRTAVTVERPVAAVISATIEAELVPTRAIVEQLQAVRPDLVVAVGGGMAPEFADIALVLPAGLTAAADALAQALANER